MDCTSLCCELCVCGPLLVFQCTGPWPWPMALVMFGDDIKADHLGVPAFSGKLKLRALDLLVWDVQLLLSLCNEHIYAIQDAFHCLNLLSV